MKRWVSPVILLLLVLGLLALRYYQSRSDAAHITAAPAPTHLPGGRVATRPVAQVPAHVLKVLDFVQKNGRAPEDYVGGREFQNRENRLPKKDQQGHLLQYREWDVHPKVPGQNRGMQRLVTGSDRSAWYTADHYRTFQKIE